MAEYDGIIYFHKAGLRHLRDAKELLESPTLLANERDADTRHLQGAMYLAGYAIECVLKEFLIVRQPRAQRISDVIQERRDKGLTTPDIAGAVGHNLSVLWDLTALAQEMEQDEARKRDWGICLRWKVSLRYGPATEDRQFAEAFVEAVERTYRWISQRI